MSRWIFSCSLHPGDQSHDFKGAAWMHRYAGQHTSREAKLDGHASLLVCRTSSHLYLPAYNEIMLKYLAFLISALRLHTLLIVMYSSRGYSVIQSNRLSLE